MTRVQKAAICAIAVMAKAPRAGRCKTRLVPRVTPEQAARLSAAFLRDVTENIAEAAKSAPIQGCIAYAPAGLESLFDGHVAAGTGMVLADGGMEMPDDVQGFGRCLLHAVTALLDEGYGAACVLNADSPNLPTSILIDAAARLAAPGDRAVLGPAADGGYYLLGLKKPHSRMFAEINWSTALVAEQTVRRARELDLELSVLPTWFDVDDAAALDRLIHDKAAVTGLVPYAAPATHACISRLGLHGPPQDLPRACG